MAKETSVEDIEFVTLTKEYVMQLEEIAKKAQYIEGYRNGYRDAAELFAEAFMKAR